MLFVTIEGRNCGLVNELKEREALRRLIRGLKIKCALMLCNLGEWQQAHAE